MAGSTIGRLLTLTTFGESHGKAIGAVLDGFPAGMALSEEDIQPYLDRRRPNASALSTSRKESDRVELLSGVFEGRTTGTPIAMLLRNEDAHSSDYDALKDLYRPGHADMTYDAKYGFRDHRGGGRSSGRETAARVMGGAVCAKLLKELGITVQAKALTVGTPAEGDSAGGVIEVVMKGVPAGVGDPVFDKLDARLASALMSIGAVKAVEVGAGVSASSMRGSEMNDAFTAEDGQIKTKTNHAGGILGGISDGMPVILRCHVKPTPSISLPQESVNRKGEPVTIEIGGRHDAVIVPRAVVVAECMCAFTLLDLMLCGMGARMKDVKKRYSL